MVALHARKTSGVHLYDFSGMKVYEAQKTSENFLHNVKTMLYHRIVCSKMVAQVSLMKKDKDARPHPLQTETLNVSVR
jgi:hypothetical protein